MAITDSSETTSKIPLPSLPPRYEIRLLTAQHESWTTAMQYHSNIFHSPHKYTPYFHGRKTKFTLNAVRTSPSAFGYAIKHNRCWGVFDTEYVYRRQESAATGGAVYWDELWDQLGPDGKLPGDDNDETLGDHKLLEAMDFPLVSFAISHDDTISAPMDLLMEMARAAPDVVKLYVAMDVLRAEQKKKAIEEGRFEETKGRVGWRLKRAGTATRSDYEGRGIMKALNLWVLDYAEKEGFTRVMGNTSNRAVGHVWLDLPSRIEGRQWSSALLGSVTVQDHEEEVDDGNGGKKIIKPFEITSRKSSQWIEVYLNPKPVENGGATNGHA